MSFECKYKNNDRCELLDKDCDPGQKGCVIAKKVKFVEPPRMESEKRERRR